MAMDEDILSRHVSHLSRPLRSTSCPPNKGTFTFSLDVCDCSVYSDLPSNRPSESFTLCCQIPISLLKCEDDQ